MIDPQNSDYLRAQLHNIPMKPTHSLYKEGKIQMFINHRKAFEAVFSGVPMGAGGKLALFLMLAAIPVGILLALIWSWWWFFIGIAMFIGNFKVLRHFVLNAVEDNAFTHERLFYIMRRNGTIWFEPK